ncbi:hypothetical protein SprV_0200792500 [Sparganum proliferum]
MHPSRNVNAQAVADLPTLPADVPGTKRDRTPEPSPPSSSIASKSAAAASVPTTTAHNPDTPTNIDLPTVNANDVNMIYTYPHCDRTLTSHIGLVGHLRIHSTEPDEPVPETPTYTRCIRLNCPHCARTFTHLMGLFGHMCIHESGNDSSLDTPNASCEHTMPNPMYTLSPSAPSAVSSTTLSAFCTPTMPNLTHTPSPSTSIIYSSTTAAVSKSDTDVDTADFSCAYCPLTFTSHN